ncbi:MAG: CoA-binding protein [Candidatus Eisenbacteria bacterium]
MSGRILTREEEYAEVIRGMRSIGVFGIKDGTRPDAPAYTIPRMLAEQGYAIVGINPMVNEALGKPVLPALDQLTAPVDVLDVFRRSDAIPELADAVLALPEALRPRTVWLQSGIRHDASAERLAAAGMDVVQDACLGVLARRYGPR